jgi:hypothetical protein
MALSWFKRVEVLASRIVQTRIYVSITKKSNFRLTLAILARSVANISVSDSKDMIFEIFEV